MIRLARAKSLTLAIGALLAPVAAAGFPANSLFVADATAGAVLRLADDCSVAETLLAGGALAGAVDLAFGPDGKLYVARADRIVELDSGGDVVSEFGSGSGIAGVSAIEFGPGGHLFVACASQDRVVEFDVDGNFVRSIGDAATLSDPRGLAIGPNGNLFVASAGTDRICEFAPSGEWLREFGDGTGLDEPQRLAFGPRGVLFVASIGTGRILGFEGSTLVAVVGQENVLSGPLAFAFGPDSRMYVAEQNGGDLYCFDSEHVLAGNWPAVSATPSGIAFAPYRFDARIEGTLARVGAKKVSTKEKVTLSIHPGTDQVMIHFAASAPDASLADADGGESIVWHGFQIDEGDGAKFRSAEGLQISANAAAHGTSSIGLRITGSLDAQQRFVMKKASGTIHRAAGGFVFSGEIYTVAQLD